MTLLEMEPLYNIIKLTLQTGYIKDGKASSLLILGKAESGKTEGLEDFKSIPGVYYTNDLTPKPVVEKIFPLIDEDKVHHIIVPDIINALERNRSTRQQIINLLKTLVEEGVTRLDAFHLRYETRYKDVIQAGLITAITAKSFNEFKREWVKTGFLSRMVPFSLSFSFDKIKKIYDYIAGEEFCGDTLKHKIIRTKKTIEGDTVLFKEFELFSSRVGSQVEAYGFRLQKNFQLLAKANAMLDGREKVIRKDIEHIFTLTKWINYDFNPL
jgi:hypothetical protein